MSCGCVCWVCISPNPNHASLCAHDCKLLTRETVYAASPITTSDKIVALLNHLNEDEQRVVLQITQRLVMGAEQYGSLDIATDRRDWTKEAGEELADLVVYLAIKALAVPR